MEITRQSPFSGKVNTLFIKGLTQANIDLWQSGELIQNAMPHISSKDREFIKTGITPEEWDEVFN